MTLGAGPENGDLVSNLNRKRDINLANNQFSQQCVDPLNRSEDQLIQDLLDADNNFRDNLDYEFFPQSWTNGFNSNSYISGLLNATGLQNIVPPDTPGFTKAVPINGFTIQP